jgi:O-antigen/teichoic acid export membrane protein
MNNSSPSVAAGNRNVESGWIGSKKIEGGLKRNAVRSWAITATSQGAKFIMTLVSTAVIARMLSPADYGLVAMVTSLLGFIAMFKDLGLSQATIQRNTITEQQVSGLFWVNVLMGVLLMGVIAVAAPLVSVFYNRPELTWICLAYAAMAPIGSLGAQHAALLNRAMKFRSLAIRDLTATLIGALVGILCAVKGLGYWSLVIMQAAGQIAGTVTLWWQSNWRPGLPRWSHDLKPLIKFGGTLTISNLLSFVNSGLDSIVIGYFFGPVGLGIYNRAQNTLSRPLKQILPPIMSVASSAFARTASDPKKFEAATLQLTFLVACVSSLIVALAVACTDWIVLIMLGPNWSEAVPITRVLALFAFVEPVASMMGTLMTARGIPGKLVRWRLISAAIILAGLVAGLPWGPLGVATAYALSGFFIRTPIFIWYSCKHLEIPPGRVFGRLTAPLLAGLITLACLYGLRINLGEEFGPVLSLAVYSIAGCVIFLAGLGCFPFARRELRTNFALVLTSLRASKQKK